VKIALITDTHWGIRNDSIAFQDNSKRFLDDIFFPTLLRDGIGNVLHLGDLVDRRKYVNFLTAKRLREDFLEPLKQNNIHMDIIAGNHDVFYKNTNKVNALTELVTGNYNNISVYTDPTEISYNGTKMLLLPWICDENREQSLKFIKETDAQIAMGHLELQGYEMFKGSVVSHGDDPSLFNRFDIVCSGHFHHRSTDGHIWYLGSHAEFTWSDWNDPKGFHIFDTETRELKFIRNPYTMFEKIWYNDTDSDFLNADVDYSKYKGKIVKVIVQNKTNLYWFDKFIENLESENLLDLQIVEDHLNLNLEDDNDIVNEAESTINIFKKYIEGIDTKTVNKEKLEKKIIDLYNEALAVE